LFKKANILITYLFTIPLIFIYSQQIDDRSIAAVGNHNITLSEFNERYNSYLLLSGAKDNIVVRDAILNKMINEILLYFYDHNEEILNDPEYIKELEETKERIILSYLKDQEVYAKITVTEQEMRDAFSRVNEEIAARHLFAKSEEEANNLYELVKIGVEFELLAKQVFTDSVLKSNGGYLGYFTWGDMDPAFEDAAYSLKIGEISTPVRTEYGYSIIKLEDRITNPLLTESEFQRKKPHLENVIKMRKKEPSEREYIKSIFDESKLKFNDENLEKISVNFSGKKNTEFDNYDSQLKECARYNDEVYYQDDIEKRIVELPDYHRRRINSLENLKAVIEGILLKEILYSIAVSKGYDTTKVVLDKISDYNLNVFLKYKKDQIINKSELPDSVVYKYYKDNITSFSTEPELNLQEILVDTKEMADSIKNLLNQGIDFGELAKKYSIRKWSAVNNGEIGLAPLSKFGSYKDLFWNSKLSQIIGPIEIEGIYGIFKLLEKLESKPIDFSAIEGEVLVAAQLENQTEILQDYLNKIRKKVNISINEELLNSYEVMDIKY